MSDYQYLLPSELNIKLIGVTGKAQSGKSSFCQIAYNKVELADWRTQSIRIFAFADPIKFCAAKALGLDIDEFYENELKEKVSEFWGVSPREVLQYFGTEIFRESIKPLFRNSYIENDFWIKRLYGILTSKLQDTAGDIENYKNSIILIEDVRFQNEVDFVEKNKGNIVYITKSFASSEGEGDKHVGIKDHKSEQYLLNLNPETTKIILNDTNSLEAYEAKVVECLKSLGFNVPY